MRQICVVFECFLLIIMVFYRGGNGRIRCIFKIVILFWTTAITEITIQKTKFKWNLNHHLKCVYEGECKRVSETSPTECLWISFTAFLRHFIISTTKWKIFTKSSGGWFFFFFVRILSPSRLGLYHRSFSFPLYDEIDKNKTRCTHKATILWNMEIWIGRERPTLFVSSQKLTHIPTIRIVAIHFYPKLYFRRLHWKTALNLFHKFFFSLCSFHTHASLLTEICGKIK